MKMVSFKFVRDCSSTCQNFREQTKLIFKIITLLYAITITFVNHRDLDVLRISMGFTKWWKSNHFLESLFLKFTLISAILLFIKNFITIEFLFVLFIVGIIPRLFVGRPPNHVDDVCQHKKSTRNVENISPLIDRSVRCQFSDHVWLKIEMRYFLVFCRCKW